MTSAPGRRPSWRSAASAAYRAAARCPRLSRRSSRTSATVANTARPTPRARRLGERSSSASSSATWRRDGDLGRGLVDGLRPGGVEVGRHDGEDVARPDREDVAAALWPRGDRGRPVVGQLAQQPFRGGGAHRRASQEQGGAEHGDEPIAEAERGGRRVGGRRFDRRLEGRRQVGRDRRWGWPAGWPLTTAATSSATAPNPATRRRRARGSGATGIEGRAGWFMAPDPSTAAEPATLGNEVTTVCHSLPTDRDAGRVASLVTRANRSCRFRLHGA